jgi:ribosomal protein L11
MEQLLALGVEPGDENSAAKSLAALKIELVQEKVTRKKAQIEAKTLTRAVDELKETTDQLTA